MQYVIDIPQGKDQTLILALLERMQVVYKPMNALKKEANPVQTDGQTDHSIDALLTALNGFTDPAFADNIENGQKNWQNWTIETW